MPTVFPPGTHSVLGTLPESLPGVESSLVDRGSGHHLLFRSESLRKKWIFLAFKISWALALSTGVALEPTTSKVRSPSVVNCTSASSAMFSWWRRASPGTTRRLPTRTVGRSQSKEYGGGQWRQRCQDLFPIQELARASISKLLSQNGTLSAMSPDKKDCGSTMLFVSSSLSALSSSRQRSYTRVQVLLHHLCWRQP